MQLNLCETSFKNNAAQIQQSLETKRFLLKDTAGFFYYFFKRWKRLKVTNTAN